MPLILPGNVAAATAATTFDAANSCRFSLGDSPYMQKTQVAPTSQQKWTYSGWLKKIENTSSAHQVFFAAGTASDSIYFDFKFKTDDTLDIEMDSTTGGSTTALQTGTTFLFRDPAAWYHVVVAVDSTQSTAADRSNLYVNGVKLTGPWTQEVYPPEDHNFGAFAADSIITVGRSATASNQYFNGYMAEVVFIDGTQYAASDFGEFDEDSPSVWKPKDVSGLTFGNNGFYLDFEASDNLGNDVNGGTDLTETNLAATDQMTDSPTNNFPISNPLMHGAANLTSTTHSQGNLIVTADSNAWRSAVATFGASAGKWYMECKFTTLGNAMPGVIGEKTIAEWGSTGCDHPGKCDLSVAYYSLSGIKIVEDTNSSYGDSFSTSDIIGTALDLDNGFVYFSKNNTWQDSGDPTSGATGTGAITLPTFAGTWFFMQGTGGNPTSAVCELNYGNPAFALSSAESDANGYGSFEYAPPSGYLALCTINLGSDGG